jgi:hypothetical protein
LKKLENHDGHPPNFETIASSLPNFVGGSRVGNRKGQTDTRAEKRHHQ